MLRGFRVSRCQHREQTLRQLTQGLMWRSFRVSRCQHVGGKTHIMCVLMWRGLRVSRCQHMAKTYTTFEIVERSTILGFMLRGFRVSRCQHDNLDPLGLNPEDEDAERLSGALQRAGVRT
jgi:putative component of membrane protein insertase Oxa1/YidC/SpoIIIJ protein YidD